MAKRYFLILLAVLLILPVVSLADLTGDHPPEHLVFQQTGSYGVVYDTVPNLALGSLVGSFDIVGIPQVSPIVKAYLYLNGVEIDDVYQGAGGSFNLTNLPWKNVADYTDDLALGNDHYWCTGYKWDVTTLVTGSGVYSVRLSGPTVCLSAFLVVVYEDIDVLSRQVSITMGEEALGFSAAGAGGTSVVHIPNVHAGEGHLFLFGEGIWSLGDERLWFNGVGGDVDVFSYLGQAFDAGTVITVDGENTVTLRSLGDLLLWKIVVLISPPGTGPDPIDKIEAKLDRDLPRIEEKLDLSVPQINLKIDGLERKLDGLGDLNVGEIIKNIAKLEEKSDKLEGKVDPVGDQLEAIEEKIDKHFGDVSFYNMEEKIDNIGTDLSGGLTHLNQVATAAAIAALERKLDEIGPNVETALWDDDIGLTSVQKSIAYVERKLDSQEQNYWWMLDYLYTTQATIVVNALNGLETKLDRGVQPGIETIIRILHATDATLAMIERKLDNQPDWSWYTSFEDYVYNNFDGVLGHVARLETKLDQGVQPGIATIIRILHATDATLAMIEAKLDDMSPLIDEIWSYQPDIAGTVTGNNQLLLAIEAKLDQDGIAGAIDHLESKMDVIGPEIGDILAYATYIPDISGAVAGNAQLLDAIEAKLDGDGGLIYAIDHLESKVDVIGPEIGDILAYATYIPDISGAVAGNAQLLDAIEAKLDAQDGLPNAIGYLESKMDTISPEIADILAYATYIPDIAGTVAGNSQALGAIETKIDGEVSGGIDDIKSSVSTLDFKIDQVEMKILHGLLVAGDYGCLPPIIFTPVCVNPYGKLEEVMSFVKMTLDDLMAMGYIQYDSRSWAAWYAGEAAYQEGQWLTAGQCFYTSYHYAMIDCGACQQQ